MYEEMTERFILNKAKELLETAKKADEGTPKPTLKRMQSGRGMFGTYKDALTQDEVTLTADILDGLYKNTIMFRIIERLSDDILSDGYVVKTGNDQADLLIEDLHDVWSLDQRKNAIKDYFKFGNSFDFINWAADGKTILSFEEIDIRYLQPHYDDQNYIDYYTYIDSEQRIEKDQLLHLAFARPKTEDFGLPLTMPAAATLHLLLNSNQNVGILIDRYAVPIIHWMLDSGLVMGSGQSKPVTPEQIQEFIKSLIAMRSGEDVVTDKNVMAKVLGLEGSVWNFDTAVSMLNDQFHAICGVPAMLLGYAGSNKEISTRLMQGYYDTNRALKGNLGWQLIQQAYKPFLVRNGYDTLRPTIEWKKLEIEERSQKIVWVRPMYQDGAITLGEYRGEMGMAEQKPKETQISTVPADVVKNDLSQTFGQQVASGREVKKDAAAGPDGLTPKAKKDQTMTV